MAHGKRLPRGHQAVGPTPSPPGSSTFEVWPAAQPPTRTAPHSEDPRCGWTNGPAISYLKAQTRVHRNRGLGRLSGLVEPFLLVGTARFELATPCSQSRCA